MFNPLKIFKVVLFALASTLAYFLCLIVVPLLCIVAVPFHIYRVFIIKVAGLIRPDLRNVLTMRGNLISQGIRNNELCNCLYLTFTMEGTITTEEVRRLWNERIMNIKLPDGQLRYPELQQYIYKWWGYLFWKQDPTFSLANHIKRYDHSVSNGVINKAFSPDSYTKIYPEIIENSVHDPDSVNRRKLISIRSDGLVKPFPRERSPWEITVIENYMPDNAEEGKHYSALTFRWNHTLADGYSILKLFLVYLNRSPLNLVAKTKIKKPHICYIILYSLVWGYKELVKAAYLPWNPMDKNDFHLPLEKTSHQFYLSVPAPIPLAKLKELSKLHRVTVSAIVQAAVAGGIRGMMLKRDLKVPQYMIICVPLPLHGHPDKLRNFATASGVPFPIGIDDPLERLKAISRMYENLKVAPYPFIMSLAANVMGAVPYGLVRKLSTIDYVSIFLSNFPGPAEQVTLFDRQILSVDVAVSPPYGAISLCIIAVSMAGMIRPTINIEKNLLQSEKEVDEFNEFFLKELDLLQYLAA